MFITFEGTEGSGKSTQCRLLCDFLRRRGHKVLRAAEPGGTRLSRALRRLLLRARFPIGAEAETLLYMASRAELVREVLRPALRRRKIVVCDRWLDATFAYQGYGLGVDPRWIEAVAQPITRGLRPDLTLFLDVPLGTGLARARRRGTPDRIERRALKFHERVRRGYLALERKHRRIVRIPVTAFAETQARIREAVLRVL